MMHSKETNTVVVLCDSKKKPLREFQTETYFRGRKSIVNIQFNSEYQFLIKNNDNRRLKISVDIDGSSIGNDLIIDGNGIVYLERFISHNSKFKFVPLSDDSVSDPTSSENGIITVRVVLEKDLENFNYTFKPTIKKHYTGSPYFNDFNTGSPYFNDFNTGSPYFNDFNTIICDYNVSNNTVYHTDQNIVSNGATIDGSISEQLFNTTFWGGDYDSGFEFKFKLMGIGSELTEIEKNEIKLLKELKAKYPNI